MENIEKNGVSITPMNDFWVDCYTTAIFSALLSLCEVDKRLIYRNSYEYVFDRNKKNMGRVYIKTDIDDYVDGFLIKNEKHAFSRDEDVIARLKEYLDQRKLVMMGVDMFYGVNATSQWHKYHIHHHVIVEKYDDEQKKVVVLETANEGYKEYFLSYDEITQAAKEFEGDSNIYSVNSKFRPRMYSVEQTKDFSKKICNSIEEIMLHIEDIWHVEDKYLISMKDEIEVHLRSMANRQKVNYLLLSGLDSSGALEGLIQEFKKLEEGYNNLCSTIIELCVSKQYFVNESKVKDCFSELLKREESVWKAFDVMAV